MSITVDIKQPYIFYRKSTHEWVVLITIVSDFVATNISFPIKRKNKAKKNFYKFCTSGILGEEMKYRIKEGRFIINENL